MSPKHVITNTVKLGKPFVGQLTPAEVAREWRVPIAEAVSEITAQLARGVLSIAVQNFGGVRVPLLSVVRRSFSERDQGRLVHKLP